MTDLFDIAAVNLKGTRTNEFWNSQPGSIDPLNTATIFTNCDRHGIPLLEPTQFIPDRLAAWHNPKDRAAAAGNGAIHFFADDYRFEGCWRKPVATFDRIAEVGAALTPDFSVWLDMPPVMQAWQVYRSRWLGAYWQAMGVTVIPTVRWAREDTWELCVESLPTESVLAVGFVGLARYKDVRELFREGFHRMVESRRPTHIVWYGVDPPFDTGVPTTVFSSSWQRRAERGRVL